MWTHHRGVGGPLSLGGSSKNPKDLSQLVHLVLAREERAPQEELGQDAPKTPHVYGHAVSGSQNDLGGSIEPGLNVSVDSLVFVA